MFTSQIDTTDEKFARNRRDMLALVEKLKELNERGAIISAKRQARFESRGQLLPRERLARLLDPGMPFLTLGNIAGYLLDTAAPDKSIPGSTVITGIGFIGGAGALRESKNATTGLFSVVSFSMRLASSYSRLSIW